jgi:hypothetical protein
MQVGADPKFRLRRSIPATLAAAVLAVSMGCSPLPPYDTAAVEQGSAGVLWSRTHYRNDEPYYKFERITYATVSRVDGQDNKYWRPLNLDAGPHAVEVSYERQSFLCGYLGCVDFKQSSTVFELAVESGHSYMPFARRYCDQDWVGILDTGGSAADDVATWQRLGAGGTWALGDLSRLGPDWIVVAGDKPPATCNGDPPPQTESANIIQD